MNQLPTWLFRIGLGGLILGWLATLVLHIDELKFNAFERACSGASERIYKHQHFTEFAIIYRPWSGVMEDHYYPYDLAKEVFRRQSFEKVQLFFEMPRDKVAASSCVGSYVIEARQADDIEIQGCGKMTPAKSVARSNILVKYDYGDKNFFDVRPFNVAIVNTQTGEILAEQKSFQLLLGGMTNQHHRVMYGWGSAEGARVCKLTKPLDFLNKVSQQDGGAP